MLLYSNAYITILLSQQILSVVFPTELRLTSHSRMTDDIHTLMIRPSRPILTKNRIIGPRNTYLCDYLNASTPPYIHSPW